MATVLRRLRLKRVSLVDTPANEEARVVLFKSADETTKQQPSASEVNVDEMVTCKKCGTSVAKGSKECSKCGAPMNVSKADDRQEDAMEMEKMKADLDAAIAKSADATAQAETLAAEVKTLTAERDELKAQTETPEAIEKRKLEALPQSVRERIEKSEATIKRLEDEKSEAEMVTFVTKSASKLPGKHEDNGKLLKRVKDAVSTEDFEALSTILKAASAQIEKGKLFVEVGRDGDGDPTSLSPIAQVEKAIADLVAKDTKMSRADAQALVFQNNPELYAAYGRSVTADVNRRGNADAN